MSLIEQVPLSDLLRRDQTVTRSGIIPYVILNNQVHWLMTRAISGRLGDFGGQANSGETAFECAFRELNEESSGLLTHMIYQTMSEIAQDPTRWSQIQVWRARTRQAPYKYRYLTLVPIAAADYNTSFRPNAEVLALLWITQGYVLDQLIPIDSFLTTIQQFIRFFRRI